MTHRIQKSFKTAEKILSKGLKVFEAIPDNYGIATALHKLGYVRRWNGHYDAAEKDFLRAKESMERLGDRIGIRAEEYFECSRVISEKLNDRWNWAITLNNLGLNSVQAGESVKAEEYFRAAVPLREKLGNKRQVFYALYRLLNVLLDQDKGADVPGQFGRIEELQAGLKGHLANLYRQTLLLRLSLCKEDSADVFSHLESTREVVALIKKPLLYIEDSPAVAFTDTARFLAARGEMEQALALVNETERILGDRRHPCLLEPDEFRKELQNMQDNFPPQPDTA